MRFLILLLFGSTSLCLGQITIDGNATEWTGTAPGTDNSAVYIPGSAGSTVKLNEWIWKDAAGDQRTDLGSTVNDLLELRLASDNTNLYFLAKVSPNQTGENQLQISLRRPGSSSTQTALSGFAETQVPTAAAWDYLIVTRGGSGNSNNIVWRPDFSMTTPGSYAENKTTGILEGSVPWASLGGVPADLQFLMTFSLYQADGSDATLNIGGSSVSNCLDFVTTTAGNTYGALPSNTLDYAALVSFLSDDNVLPIRLASFNASRIGSGCVRLQWTTLTEISTYGFMLERRQEDETAFEKLPHCFIAGHGTSTEQHTYAYTDSTVTAGVCFYRLKEQDLDGTYHISDPVRLDVVSAVRDQPLAAGFFLFQNYPNPFNPTTTIRYGLPHRSHVLLTVYNTLGEEVAELVNGDIEAGYHEVQFDASHLASSVYFYRIQAEGFIQTKSLLLLK